jgi:hypothetical protein
VLHNIFDKDRSPPYTPVPVVSGVISEGHASFPA